MEKMLLRAGTCLSTSLIYHKHNTSPGAVLFPSSPGWEILGTVRESLRELGKRGWKSESKKVPKNAELEEAQGEKERTGEFNQSEEVLQPQASSGELEKGTWGTSYSKKQK